MLIDKDDRRWRRIWCDACGMVQGIETDYLGKSAENPHNDGLDLMCTECHFVIATLHGPSVGGGDRPRPA